MLISTELQRLGEELSKAAEPSGVSVEDFYCYMPTHRYLFVPTLALWQPISVDRRVGQVDDGGKKIAASAWLDLYRPVDQMTWMPGEPMFIKDRLMTADGFNHYPGKNAFNTYRAPSIKLGEASSAGLWVDHMRRVFGDDTEHLLKWFAHRVQKPAEKINHAIVLGGNQGIGKDTALEPVKRAVGAANFNEVSPQHVLGRFNGYLKSVILRISEARDFGEFDRFKFYDHAKAYIASPPDVLRVDEKHLQEYVVPNCCGVIITTNHKTDGIYLPSDDRRHYVAWSNLTRDSFEPDYWCKLWSWYDNGGDGHVAAYLTKLNLAGC